MAHHNPTGIHWKQTSLPASFNSSMSRPRCPSIVGCLIFMFWTIVSLATRLPEIGIITPYTYQVKLIEQRLSQYNLHQHKIEMGTGRLICEHDDRSSSLGHYVRFSVDAFQGRQKDVIVLSCVRATQMTDASTAVSIGFVANRQRLNVSLTRAKYGMYILGHMNSLNVRSRWCSRENLTKTNTCFAPLDQWGLEETLLECRRAQKYCAVDDTRWLCLAEQTAAGRTNTFRWEHLTDSFEWDIRLFLVLYRFLLFSFHCRSFLSILYLFWKLVKRGWSLLFLCWWCSLYLYLLNYVLLNCLLKNFVK